MDGGQLCVLWLWGAATAPGSSTEGAWSPVWAVHTADRLGVGDWYLSTWATSLHG